MSSTTEEPRLHARESEDVPFVIPAPEERTYMPADPRPRISELPWYAIFRIPIAQLVTLGTLLLALYGVWYRVQDHDRQIAEVKATAQSKESASGDMKLVLSKLDDLKERLERIEDQVQRGGKP